MSIHRKLFKAGARAGLDYAANFLNDLANDAARAAETIEHLDRGEHLRAVAAALRCASYHLLSRDDQWWMNE